MVDRLVDVLNSKQTVLHTFPITIEDPEAAAQDAAFEEKAVKAAAFAQLAPAEEFSSLTTRMHVSRGGPVAPYGDDRDILLETPESIERSIRECAYFIWQCEGCAEGLADEHWHRAREQRLRERAYVLWQQEGCPEGRADEHWHQTLAFQAPV